MRSRLEVLQSLLTVDRPLEGIVAELRAFEWDSDEELVVLDADAALSVLHRFMRGELSGPDLELWANAVEGRDDIGFSDATRSALSDFVHRLANPELTDGITLDSAHMWSDRLKRLSRGRGNA